MADKDGVTQPGTPAGEGQEDPSRQGDSHVLPDGRSVREVLEENKRKSDELKSLKAENEEFKDRLAELEEKEKRQGLTRSESKEKDGLEDATEDLDLLLAKAEKDPDNKLLLKMIDKITDKKLAKRELDQSFDRQEAFLDGKAEAEKVTVKELRKKLAAYCGPYQHEPPHLQAEHAYRDFKRFSEIESKEQKLKEREKQEQDYVEGGSPTGGGLTPNKKRFSPAETRDESLAALANM